MSNIDNNLSDSQSTNNSSENPKKVQPTRSSHVSLRGGGRKNHHTGPKTSKPGMGTTTGMVPSHQPVGPASSANTNLNKSNGTFKRGGNDPRRGGRGGRNQRKSNPPTVISPDGYGAHSDSPNYVVRKAEHQNALADKLQNLAIGAKISKSNNAGNEHESHINPALIYGQHLQTNSPKNFEQGPVVRLIPLGGVAEVGMNMTILECGDDIVIIDTGFAFGNEKMPGVDYIIPDISYLEQNRHKIRGLIYTHGHLDHIGGAPYILPKLGDINIYGMPLTLALLKSRLEEFELSNKIRGFLINTDKPLQLGCFKFNFFHLNHSLPDVVGLAIDTPMGRIMYCTDWKFDHYPVDGKPSDYGKIAQYGADGVRLLLSDSTNAMVPGYSLSEKEISKTLIDIFKSRKDGKIVIATFSTLIGKMQQVINSCEVTNRKLVVLGRSMINNFNIATQLGYLRVPKGMVIMDNEIGKYHPSEVAIITTGSQGEDNAGLAKMARNEHPTVKLEAGDMVMLSNSVIPGNEADVAHLTSMISRLGVDVINNKMFDIHSGGHAKQEDLKMMIALCKPDYFQPIHGEHFMLVKHGELAQSLGVPKDHILISDNGRVTELNGHELVLKEDKVTENYVLVDGTGVGDVSIEVINDRQLLAKEGVLVIVMTINKKKELVGNPEIISRGFVYMKSAGDLIANIKSHITTNFDSDIAPFNASASEYWSTLRSNLKRSVSNYIFKKTEKEPMILPVVVQV
ncbi:MAG: ribonuclease J [Patescibacteria group bacterium]